MARSSRQDDFLRYRTEFPYFIFESQEYTLSGEGLSIRFSFDLAGKLRFFPSLFIPRKSYFLPAEQLAGRLDSLVFSIGMTELISYWKAACPPTVIIRPFSLAPAQVAWWKKLYYQGLGEFFYLNSITTGEDDFMEVRADEGPVLPVQRFNPAESVIIPVGGGKDSAVTLELLGSLPGSIPLILNPRGASLDTIRAAGFQEDNFIGIHRTLDPGLLALNETGFLNGHTPFSALLAFITALAAVLSGRRHIALSNESSASEATIAGTTINHQYSKSFGFETDFRDYLANWISPDINYFSFLRPLNELQIASLFARLTRYHTAFRSCNAGSKTDSWCGHCAKCLFTWIILSPFMEESALTAIFGRNLFTDSSLLPFLEQLAGIAEEKPFDCVGTVNEVNLALCETIRHYEDDHLPSLLASYRNSEAYGKHCDFDFHAALASIAGGHRIPERFWMILKQQSETGRHD